MIAARRSGDVGVLVDVTVRLADRGDAMADIKGCLTRHSCWSQAQLLEPVSFDVISIPCGLGNHGDQRFLGD